MVVYDKFEFLEYFSLIKSLLEISEKCDITLLKTLTPSYHTLSQNPKHPNPPLGYIISEWPHRAKTILSNICFILTFFVQ